MDTIWKIVATLGLVGLNAYFVAVEFAAVSARSSRLQTLHRKSLGVRAGLRIKKRLDLYLSSCQLGNTLAALALGAVTEPAVSSLIRPVMQLSRIPDAQQHWIAFVISFSIVTFLHIVIGEQAPKNWAIRFSDRILINLSVPLVIFTQICYPAIWLLNTCANTILRWSGVEIDNTREGGAAHSENELRALLGQAVQAGTISKANQQLLTGAFEFNDLKARQIMTPRTRVDFLKLKQPMGEILHVIQRSAYTRLPLCDVDIDHVVGLVHMKDLFNALKLVPGKLKFIDETGPEGEIVAIPTGLPGSAVHVIGSGDIDLTEVKRDVLFVPELLPLPKLLRQFQTSQTHMAIVVDEYGATQGIVTLEDVIEQIVGEIEDEFDTRPPLEFVKEGESFKVTGTFPLHELREKLSLAEFEPGTVDTLGGYITQSLRRLPRVGDIVPLGRYTARVVSVHRKSVSSVFITPAIQDKSREDAAGTA